MLILTAVVLGTIALWWAQEALADLFILALLASAVIYLI